MSWYNIQDDFHRSNDNWFRRFVKGLNNALNPGHAWFDYDAWEQKKTPLENFVESFAAKTSGTELTGAEKAANQFTADEAQKQRDFEEYMSSTAYQRQVADMRAAGVNPAMAMSGSGGASTPSGAAATSVSPSSGVSFSDLMQLFMLPVQKKLVQSQAKLAEDQGKAALMNAGANVRNAGSNERQAGAAEMRAETDRMRQEVEAWMAKLEVPIKENQAAKLAQETAQLKVLTEQLPERLDVLKQQGNAAEQQALASLQSSLAALRNAAVNEKLSDAEMQLRYSQAYVNWANGEGQRIVNRYLDENQQRTIQELSSRSDFLESNARNMDRNAKVQWMQTITGYVGAACTVANTVMQGLSVASGLAPLTKVVGF